MIRCADDSLYTGIATDVARRLDEHRTSNIGSKYLRGRAPLELVFEREVGDRSRASKVESRIKKMPRHVKEKILELPAIVDEMVQDMS
jgi:putative endonuclease